MFTLNELEQMFPWEREVYIGLVAKYIQKKNSEEN